MATADFWALLRTTSSTISATWAGVKWLRTSATRAGSIVAGWVMMASVRRSAVLVAGSSWLFG